MVLATQFEVRCCSSACNETGHIVLDRLPSDRIRLSLFESGLFFLGLRMILTSLLYIPWF